MLIRGALLGGLDNDLKEDEGSAARAKSEGNHAATAWMCSSLGHPFADRTKISTGMRAQPQRPRAKACDHRRRREHVQGKQKSKLEKLRPTPPGQTMKSRMEMLRRMLPPPPPATWHHLPPPPPVASEFAVGLQLLLLLCVADHAQEVVALGASERGWS